MWFADIDTKVLWTEAREGRSLFMWTFPTLSPRTIAVFFNKDATEQCTEWRVTWLTASL